MKRICVYSLLVIGSLTYGFCYGQNATKIRLIYKSTDINKPNTDHLEIKRIRSATFSDSLVVRLKNKKKLVLPPNRIWGYQDDDSTIYRYNDGEFYKVQQIDTLTMYSRKVGRYSITKYYFSRGTDGKLLPLDWKNLKKEFPKDACFLNKMDKGLKWFQDYSSYNDKTKSYRMIEFFKSCIGNITASKLKE